MISKRMSPGRNIAIGFLAVIIFGAALLLLPISQNDGIELSFIDALFTSASAVCVTGLVTVDVADTFTVFGRTVVALLIQIGGLGVTSLSVGLVILSGQKINLRKRTLAKEALNYGSFKGVIDLVKSVLIVTIFFELIGVILSFFVFSKDYSFWDALGISAFHSVAAFNNSGFDIFGGLRNMTPYQDNVFLTITTSILVIIGGLGFFVVKEIVEKRSFKKLSLHSKIVITVSFFLLLIGTLLLKYTENISWLGAFFHSTCARTAGFSTYPIGGFSNAGLLVLMMLMFIGASPGSTGGGIKTTTFFVLAYALITASTNKHPYAFKRKLPKVLLYKAFIILSLALFTILTSTLLLCMAEPNIPFVDLFFEVVSAFGTVGLSTGITPDLTPFSELVIIFTMYVGRLGPLTVATLWTFKADSYISYPEESVSIG